MDLTAKLLGASNIFVGVLIIAGSIPLIQQKIPMNSLYGIRFTQSYESEEHWYKINAYGGKQMAVWSIPLIILGLVTFFLPLAGNRFWSVIIACAPLIYLLPTIISYIYARQLH